MGGEACFDGDYYARVNPDIGLFIGRNASRLYRQYERLGAAEGRAVRWRCEAPRGALLTRPLQRLVRAMAEADPQLPGDEARGWCRGRSSVACTRLNCRGLLRRAFAVQCLLVRRAASQPDRSLSPNSRPSTLAPPPLHSLRRRPGPPLGRRRHDARRLPRGRAARARPGPGRALSGWPRRRLNRLLASVRCARLACRAWLCNEDAVCTLPWNPVCTCSVLPAFNKIA